MIHEIKLDMDAAEMNGNILKEVVLCAEDYKTCFNMLPENTTLQKVFGYPTTISQHSASYLLIIDQDGISRSISIASSKPFNRHCE